MADSGGGSPLLDVIGGFMGQNQQDWYKNTLVQIMNGLNNAQGQGWTYGQNQFNPASATAQGLNSAGSQLLFGHDGQPGSMTQFQDQLQAALGGVNQGQFQNSGLTPQMLQALSAMQGSAGGLGNAQGLMNQVIANGGGSAQSQSIWNNLNNLATGQGPNNSALSQQGYNLLMNPGSAMTTALQNGGQNAVQNGGMTNTLQTASNGLQDIINHGGSNGNMDQGVAQALSMLSGSNPYSQALMQQGQGGMASNLGVQGLTATGAQGESAALQGIQNQGATQDSNFFTNRGQQLASKDAVLPAMLSANLARDQATQTFKNAGEAARDQAFAHGGGPGAVVANGTTNQALADYSDKGAQGVSNAVQNSLLNSQGLNLQQQGQGAQMGLQGGQLQLGNLNDYSSLLSSLENNATNRYGVGGGLVGNAGNLANQTSQIGMQGLGNLSSLQSQNLLGSLGQMTGVQNSATNNAGTMGQLGLGAGNLQQGNQQLGGNLTNMLNQTSLAGLQGLQGNLNQANNYTLGASGALNNMTGTQGGLYNSMFGNNVNAGQLGTGQTSNFYQALSSLFGQNNSLNNNQIGMMNNGMNTLTNIGNAGFGYANTANQGLAHLFSTYQPGNALGNSLSQAGRDVLTGAGGGE